MTVRAVGCLMVDVDGNALGIVVSNRAVGEVLSDLKQCLTLGRCCAE